MYLVLGILEIIAIIVIYFVPSFIAEKRKKKSKTAIIALNFFLGWTFIGWLVSLIWALAAD